MNIDEVEKNFQSFLRDVQPKLDTLMNEATTRLRLIDRLLTDILGWNSGEIIAEPPSENGYLDYLFTVQGYNPLVIEAKRIGTKLLDTSSPKMGCYKLGGSALQSAQEGIRQVLNYSLDKGAPFAVLTTGASWIGFLTSGAGKPLKERKAFVFPTLDAVKDDFASFYDLFSREGILTKRYITLFNRAEGLSITHAGQLNFVVPDNHVRILPQHDLARDLGPVFDRFFGSLTDDNDRDLLLSCFVETKESKEADVSLEKISRDLVNEIETLGTAEGEQLAKEIQVVMETARGEVVLIVGNKGAGKSTFIQRFFGHVLVRPVRDRCLVLQIDMAQTHRRDNLIADWITEQLLLAIESQLYRGEAPEYDELKGIFIADYRRWAKGEHRPLHDTNFPEFKIKFGEYMYRERQEPSMINRGN